MRLSRTSLLSRLTSPDVPPVVLLEAPPGYGKSWLARARPRWRRAAPARRAGAARGRPSPAVPRVARRRPPADARSGRRPAGAHRGRRRTGPPADLGAPRRGRHPRGHPARRRPDRRQRGAGDLSGRDPRGPPARLGDAGQPPRRGVRRAASASSPRRSTRPQRDPSSDAVAIASRMVRAAGEAALHQLDVAPPLGRRPARPGAWHRPGDARPPRRSALRRRRRRRRRAAAPPDHRRPRARRTRPRSAACRSSPASPAPSPTT